MKGLHLANAADPMLATRKTIHSVHANAAMRAAGIDLRKLSGAELLAIEAVQQSTAAPSRCDRLGLCQNLMPRCNGCDLVRGWKPTPNEPTPSRSAAPSRASYSPIGYPTYGLSEAEAPYLLHEHTLCAAD